MTVSDLYRVEKDDINWQMIFGELPRNFNGFLWIWYE
jgi:hypothetical protein